MNPVGPVALPEPNSGIERSTATAGAGGIGGGTLLVVIANWLPSGHLRDLLIWAAPAASVTLTGLWLWVQRRVPEIYRERTQRKVIREAKETLTRGIANPHTSEPHRATLRNELE